jgi:hypothetical protein
MLCVFYSSVEAEVYDGTEFDEPSDIELAVDVI